MAGRIAAGRGLAITYKMQVQQPTKTFCNFMQKRLAKNSASPLADAIIDRIAHDSYRINITSIDAEHDISMREVYGLDKALRE